jgi:glycosyltransferase involved in cell wall biosynthesis
MSPASPRRRAAIVRRVTCDYQVPFYLALHDRLAAAGVALEVYSGAPWPGEALTDSLDALPFGRRVRYRRLGAKAFWTPGLLTRLRGADLVVLEQANAQLVNYPLLLARALRRLAGRPAPALAWIGHGAHFNRAAPAPARDAWRRFWLRRADRFFAYTARSARAVAADGFPPDRVTVFDNTTDTAALAREAARLTPEDDARLRQALFGSAADAPAGLFCGRLVPEMEIPVLLAALDRIRGALPAFRAILIGDGPERPRVAAFCETRPWCAWVGKKTGLERVPYFRLARLMLHPARAGLALQDAFALGLPFATTDNGRHSPEIEYLEPGVNGLLAPCDPAAFAAEAAALLADPERLARLAARARASGALRTIDRMAGLFAAGVLASLDL